MMGDAYLATGEVRHGPLLWTISGVCWTTKHGTSTARNLTSLCILEGNRKRSVERMMSTQGMQEGQGDRT
jgi:hypothetical protein